MYVDFRHHGNFYECTKRPLNVIGLIIIRGIITKFTAL